MNNIFKALPIAIAAVAANAQAELVQWSDTSVTGLVGSDYLVDSDKQVTGTFEYVAGLSFGDIFVFYDATKYDSDNQDYIGFYGEISPRISFDKAFGWDVGNDVLTDMSLAFTYENGRGDVESFLAGVGFDWNVPGFTYLQTNVYNRQGINNDTDGYQITPVWRMDFPVGSSNIVFDGFADWVFKSSNDNFESNLHINPQVKYDMGMLINGEQGANKFFVGIEVDYWKNKYGIKSSPAFDTNQTAVSALVKYHF